MASKRPRLAVPGVQLITTKTFQTKMGDVSSTTLWRRRKSDDDFPRPVRFGGRRLYWLLTEVDDYIRARCA